MTNLHTNFAKAANFEGEVDGFGNFGGRGISFKENFEIFMMCEGFHTGKCKLNGIGRIFFYMKRVSKCITLTGLFENSNCANGIYSSVNGESKVLGSFLRG